MGRVSVAEAMKATVEQQGDSQRIIPPSGRAYNAPVGERVEVCSYCQGEGHHDSCFECGNRGYFRRDKKGGGNAHQLRLHIEESWYRFDVVCPGEQPCKKGFCHVDNVLKDVGFEAFKGTWESPPISVELEFEPGGDVDGEAWVVLPK